MMIGFTFTALVFAALLRGGVSSSHCPAQANDKTLEEGAVGSDVVLATIQKVFAPELFPDDFEFLRRMAAVETADGDTAEPGGGGIWGISQDVFNTVTELMKRSNLKNDIMEHFCFDWTDTVTRRVDLDIPLYSALSVMVIVYSLEKETVPESIEEQADFWVAQFKNRDTSVFISTAESLLQTAEAMVEDCEIPGVDMIFVMDESGSIGSDNFELMKQLAIDITDGFEIGPSNTQVGWINFNDFARVIFNLNTYPTKALLHAAIRNVRYSSGGTRIGAGLSALHYSGFVASAGARNSYAIPEVAIVVTDGRSNIQAIEAAATLLRENRNINVFAIGVGSGISIPQLEAVALAGITNDASHVYTIGGFNEAEFSILQETIRARACFDVLFLEHEVDIDSINNGGSQTLDKDATQYINVECPPEGLTINACGSRGKIMLYISKTISRPNNALYDRIITIEEGECHNTFVECITDGSGRRRRQTEAEGRIFMTIEGVGEENEYELEASQGDSSTPQVNLLCSKQVDSDRQSVVVSCTHDRELIDVKCSFNRSPRQQCSLPWRVVFTPPVREYNLEINVTDSLNLTDSITITHTVGPLAVDCLLNERMEIECTSTNQLDLNQTVCSFRGTTVSPCILPHKIDVKGLPLGVHKIYVTATDVFGSTADTTIDYLVVGDRVGDDMVFSVVLDISPVEVGVTEQTVALCYQVHGEDGKFYNLVSDECVSVNAHVTRPFPEVNSHVIDEISVRATGTNGSCYDILVSRENCNVSVNRESIPINTYFEEGNVSLHNDRRIARRPNVIRISVPNCGRALVDTISIKCTEYAIRDAPAPTEVLEFTATRGLSPIEAAHGLVGQFWGRFMLGQSQPPLSHPRERYDKAMTIFHETTQKRFSGFVKRAWSHRDMCFYAGDRQGSPVIQGAYTDYEVEGFFDTAYQYSRFDENLCVGQEWGG